MVSDRDYFYIYPGSIWSPIGEMTKKDVSVSLDKLAMRNGFKLIVDPVVKLEAKEKRVTLKSGLVLDDYSYMAVALVQDKLQHALSICGKPEEATALYGRLDALVLKGSGKIAMGFGGNPKDAAAVRGAPPSKCCLMLRPTLGKKGFVKALNSLFWA